MECFLKKESNFKRPPKPDVIYAKLTKNLLSNHEWCGHRSVSYDEKILHYSLLDFMYTDCASTEQCLIFSAQMKQAQNSLEVSAERPNSEQIPKFFLHHQDGAASIFAASALVQPSTRFIFLPSMLSGMYKYHYNIYHCFFIRI